MMEFIVTLSVAILLISPIAFLIGIAQERDKAKAIKQLEDKMDEEDSECM